MDRKRVAIVISSDYSLHNPSLVEGCKAIACLGYSVDVLAPRKPTLPISFNGLPVRVEWFRPTLSEWKRGRRVLALIEPLILPLRKLFAMTRGKDYLCVIGVEPGGLFAASLVGLTKAIPVVYYNMELILSREVRSFRQRALKATERTLHRKTALTIVQDAQRALLLSQDNGVSIERMVYIPCGAMGPAYRKKSSLIRRRLGIDEGVPVILYAGKLAPWARVLEVADVAANCSRRWAFVFHGFPGEGPYVEALRKKVCEHPGKMFLSTTMLPHNAFEEMLCSADVGLALYEDLGANFRLTGAASNKLASYLKCGLPVVTNSYPSLKEVVERYGCGICVSSMNELLTAIEKILSQHTQYTFNALRCFQQCFDLLPFWSGFMEKIEKLASA